MTGEGTADSADRTVTRRMRAEYLAFVREHHPDVGGDQDTFVAGVAALRRRWADPPDGASPESGTPASDPYDAPIEIVRHGRNTARLTRWWRRATGPPRVR